jgi:hypothetical protein
VAAPKAGVREESKGGTDEGSEDGTNKSEGGRHVWRRARTRGFRGSDHADLTTSPGCRVYVVAFEEWMEPALLVDDKIIAYMLVKPGKAQGLKRLCTHTHADERKIG